MKIHNGFQKLNLTRPVVTVGIFDGVHHGHMAIINRVVTCTAETGGESVVITFEPHPRMVLDKKPAGFSFLSTMDEKKELLAGAGIDHLIVIRFTSGFSRMSAREFVKNILSLHLGTKHMIIGHDHRFGYRGDSDFFRIREYAGEYGIIVEQIEGVRSDGDVISSSRIRNALLSGRLDEANRWLGYNYSLKGKVVKGKGLGRSLGFPTANIEPGDKLKLVPANGVYAVEIVTEGLTRPGMLSIGTNPTVNRDVSLRSVEVHIFDFDREIYGNELEIIFRHRLRDEIRFENTGQLVRQMRTDMDNTLKILG